MNTSNRISKYGEINVEFLDILIHLTGKVDRFVILHIFSHMQREK